MVKFASFLGRLMLGCPGLLPSFLLLDGFLRAFPGWSHRLRLNGIVFASLSTASVLSQQAPSEVTSISRPYINAFNFTSPSIVLAERFLLGLHPVYSLLDNSGGVIYILLKKQRIL
jgi:hypothetical protein